MCVVPCNSVVAKGASFLNLAKSSGDGGLVRASLESVVVVDELLEDIQWWDSPRHHPGSLAEDPCKKKAIPCQHSRTDTSTSKFTERHDSKNSAIQVLIPEQLVFNMCGIHVSISTKTFQSPNDNLRQLLCSRGPDHTGESCIVFTVENGPSYWISAMSTVLALRGDQITVQPLTEPSSGSVLCWNGEAWSIGSNPITGNDGQFLFDLLVEASHTHNSVADSAVAICSILHSVSGPFAFVFVDKIHNQIYFGRDRLGRRSLLYNIDNDSTSLCFSSVADPHRAPWQEVEADAIYQISFKSGIESNSPSSIEGLLSISFASICRHLWEDNVTKGAVRIILRLPVLIMVFGCIFPMVSWLTLPARYQLWENSIKPTRHQVHLSIVEQSLSSICAVIYVSL
jgi:hypothetical protein